MALRGADLDDLWLDHLAHNTVYDYTAGLLYEYTTDAWAPIYPRESAIAATAPRSGGRGTISSPNAPHRYGSATIEIRNPDRGPLTVHVSGERTGTEGSMARYGARLVREMRDGKVWYHDLVFDGPEGSAELPAIGDAARLFLTVGTWSPRWNEDRWVTEQFPFEWSMQIGQGGDDTSTDILTDGNDDLSPEPKGELLGVCGCDAGAGTGAGVGLAWAWIGGLGALAARRSSQRPVR